MSEEKTDGKDFIPVILMGSLFVLIHGLAILVTQPFIDAGVQPAFDDINDPLNILYIFAILLVFTLVILLIAKYYKKQLIQFIILGAIGYTAAYVIYPLINLLMPVNWLINLPIGNNTFLAISLSTIIAILLAILLVVVLYNTLNGT